MQTMKVLRNMLTVKHMKNTISQTSAKTYPKFNMFLKNFLDQNNCTKLESKNPLIFSNKFYLHVMFA